MPADYVVLSIVGVIAIAGGVFLIFKAKTYRARHLSKDVHDPQQQ